MALLVALIPGYLVIGAHARRTVVHAPIFAIDGLFPLIPAWALIYGVLYAFLILLPVFVVQSGELIRRTVQAYLIVWLTSYAVFLLYPTIAPRPPQVAGEGFAVWGLRFLYDADPPYNCFPSLHVAHSLVSALACHRVHRTLGLVALSCAGLVAVSTLYTRQHYVADVVAGMCLAIASYRFCLRDHPTGLIPVLHQRVAPALALCVSTLVGLGLACFWVAYQLLG